MDKQVFNKKKIIFRQGDSADCMYCIEYGRVEIWLNYKEPHEKLLTTLSRGTFFGEMALLNDKFRSATAVAAENGTTLQVYPRSALSEMMNADSKPFRMLLKQMSSNLRHLTDNYMELCRAIANYDEAVKSEKEAIAMKELDKYEALIREYEEGKSYDGRYWSDMESYTDLFWEIRPGMFNGGHL